MDSRSTYVDCGYTGRSYNYEGVFQDFFAQVGKQGLFTGARATRDEDALAGANCVDRRLHLGTNLEVFRQDKGLNLLRLSTIDLCIWH